MKTEYSLSRDFREYLESGNAPSFVVSGCVFETRQKALAAHWVLLEVVKADNSTAAETPGLNLLLSDSFGVVFEIREVREGREAF